MNVSYIVNLSVGSWLGRAASGVCEQRKTGKWLVFLSN